MHCDDQREHLLYGFYRGIVLKHLAHGRCKIWIPTVYPNEWNVEDKADLLPSAEQASSLAFGTNNGNGVFSYPNIGSMVWCFFERGDQNFPVYFASTLGGGAAFSQWDESFAMAGNHPNDAFVHHIETGNTHLTFNESGFVKINTHDAGGSSTSTITMDSSGNITLESTDTITLKAKNITIEGSTQIDMKAPNIVENASIHSDIVSPAINLNSSTGHTVIRSRSIYSEPAMTSF